MKSSPPRCKKLPKTLTEHGQTREDPYFWLREKENPEVKAYVESENRYYESAISKLSDLKERYFEQLKSLMEPEAIVVPYPHGPYLYGSRTPEGLQYPVFFRKKDLLDPSEELLLDVNEIAKQHEYTQLGAYCVSDRHDLLAYSLDTDGSEEHRVFFKSVAPSASAHGETTAVPTHGETIEKTDGDLVFSQDGTALYYVQLNDQHRPYRLYRHLLGTDPSKDELLYEENDPRFFASIAESADGKFLLLRLQSMESIEYRYASRNADFRKLEVFSPRAPKHEYELDSQEDRFIIQSNRDEKNFILYEAGHAEPGTWHPIFRGDERTDLRDFCILKRHLAVHYGRDGVPSVIVFGKNAIGASGHPVFEPKFPEDIRDLHLGANVEFDRDWVRLIYSSPKTPQQTLDVNLKTQEVVRLHQRVVPGFNPDDFIVERTEVTSYDGVKIPVSLLSLREHRGKPLPTVLYGYGSYGALTPTGFSIIQATTARAGFRYAIAHVRGSGDLGRRWYEEGKFLKKPNTFLDFQAAAQGLVKQGYTKPGEITIHGGSAGGLLVAATLNLNPSLYRGAIAEVPFVDVLSTMFDETLPLTPIEWDEWGDPRKKEFFDVMRAYSPYDNLKSGEYPWILVNGGWNDPRVTYWEPTKYVAKLRDLRTDSRQTFLDIEMGAGHFGVTGRFDALKKPAELLAFLHAIHFEPQRLASL